MKEELKAGSEEKSLRESINEKCKSLINTNNEFLVINILSNLDKQDLDSLKKIDSSLESILKNVKELSCNE